jgi:hypothetical protein
MKIGANWTSPRNLKTVRTLLQNDHISFSEIMIDNFLHLPANALHAAFPGTPISFHIMNSQFLRRDPAELKVLAGKVRGFIRELKPLYVSDHMAVFSHEDRRLPFPQEIDYPHEYERTRDRVTMWQELLGTPLLLENYPSILDIGREQSSFLERLLSETGAELLFDFSNAVVARENCGAALADWTPLLRRARRFHLAGYRLAGTNPDIVMDSHDCAPSVDTLDFLMQSKPLIDGRDCSIIVERDANIEIDSWAADIQAVKAALA